MANNIKTAKEYIVITEDSEIIMRGSVEQIAQTFEVSDTLVRNVIQRGKLQARGVFKGLRIVSSGRQVENNIAKETVNTISFDSEVISGKGYIVRTDQKQVIIRGGLHAIPLKKVMALAAELKDIAQVYVEEKEDLK